MQVITFRASSMQEALQQVRSKLGPDAAVLQTKELGGGLGGWLTGTRQVEVVATADVQVPSRFADEDDSTDDGPHDAPQAIVELSAGSSSFELPIDAVTYRERFRQALYREAVEEDTDAPHIYSLVEDLAERSRLESHPTREAEGGSLLDELTETGMDEDLARALGERADADGAGSLSPTSDSPRSRVARLIEAEIEVTGPIHVQPAEGRVVALVGPTGVGKTTTVAKLAAHFRLREKNSVGLVTVDNYRVAAVDQLRTYAEIMGLPMEIACTPHDVRQAIDRLSGLDLILMDTAGRSPFDDLRIQELRSMLAEAQADDVHLVLSGAASTDCAGKTAKRFGDAGATAVLLTKLDEVGRLGGLLRLLRNCPLPLSYVSDGQDVPDDIEVADASKLTRRILGFD